MRKKTRFPDKGFDFPFTPLIDIVFLLLIYFLLTSQFVEHEALKVNLPETSARGEIVREVITVTITKKGEFYLNRQKVSPNDLAAEIKKAALKGANQLHLEADRGAKVQWLVQAMEAAREAGLKKMFIKTVKTLR